MLHIAQDEQFRMEDELEEELENSSQIDTRWTPPFIRTPSRREICDASLLTSSSSSSSSSCFAASSTSVPPPVPPPLLPPTPLPLDLLSLPPAPLPSPPLPSPPPPLPPTPLHQQLLLGNWKMDSKQVSRGVGSSLGKNLRGMGQDGTTSTYKGDKDTMAAGVPITRSSKGA